MKSESLLLTPLLLLLSACTGAAAAPTLTPVQRPEPGPTASPVPAPTFEAARFGTMERDVTYCTMDGLPQTLDVYFPQSGGPWPVLFYVHGGSWVEGDKADGLGWGEMAAQGYLVVSANYRLATYQVKFPAMIEDVKCAVRYLRAHAADYNLDPDRIGAIGASAGGHLAALLGASDETAGWEVGEHLDQSSRVQAVLTMAGPSDFDRDFPSLNTSIYFAFGDLAGGDSAFMTAASPVTYVTPDDPPFLILHGDKDGVVPVAQGVALHERLEEAGVESTLVIVEGGDHGLQGLNGRQTVPSQQEISETIQKFLETNLK
jgi:acetyl esterase/lipase